mgnify:CR=1 FL=1
MTPAELNKRELHLMHIAYRAAMKARLCKKQKLIDDESIKDDFEMWLNFSLDGYEAPPPMTVDEAREVLGKSLSGNSLACYSLSNLVNWWEQYRLSRLTDQQLTAYMVLRREVEG